MKFVMLEDHLFGTKMYVIVKRLDDKSNKLTFHVL